MIVVSNTSPIINLAAVGQLDLLRHLYGQVVIPQAVYSEIVGVGAGQPGADEVAASDFTVTLSWDSGALAPISAGRQVITDGNGSYQFATIAAGGYRIDVAVPSGYLPTAPGSVAIIVPEDNDVTVPPIGFAWAPAHLYLPLVQR